MTEEQKRSLVHAINHFGVEAQVRKSIEEMAELTAALARRDLERFDKDAVIEEIADALIMLQQLRIIYGGVAVDAKIAEKLERLEQRIGGDWQRQERMMPKGMIVHVPDRVWEEIERAQKPCCLRCKHLRTDRRDDGVIHRVYCSLSWEKIIGKTSEMCCGDFTPVQS